MVKDIFITWHLISIEGWKRLSYFVMHSRRSRYENVFLVKFKRGKKKLLKGSGSNCGKSNNEISHLNS